MKPYALVEDVCKKKFDFQIGQEIGYGAQGQVFEIEKQPEQVIKIATLYDIDSHLDVDQVFDKIQQVYQFLIDHRFDNIVKVHKFGRLRTGSRPTVNGTQDYIIYYCIQERLQQLSDDEKKMFKTICQAINGELELERSVEEIVKELGTWLRFDSEKVMKFYHSLSSLPIENNDFHRRNILKDAEGNFKLIDFDLARLV